MLEPAPSKPRELKDPFLQVLDADFDGLFQCASEKLIMDHCEGWRLTIPKTRWLYYGPTPPTKRRRRLGRA